MLEFALGLILIPIGCASVFICGAVIIGCIKGICGNGNKKK